MASRSRYSRWDGTQDPFGPDVPAADVLEELADDVLMGDSADAALERLLRRGMRGRFTGLDALRRRLQQRRDEEASELNVTGPLEDLRERLDATLERERTHLSFEPGDDARAREAFLDALPPDLPGKLSELRGYRFTDPEAQRMFDDLMTDLQQQVLGSYFRQLTEGMRNVSPDEVARLKDMLADLNRLLEMRDRGQETQPAFEDFMQRHGDLIPGDPRTLDELLEQMARRMAAMSRMLASLSPDQRAELRDLIAQVTEDMDLAFELDRLSANLQGAFPDMPWGEPAWGDGEGSAPMQATVDALERQHGYEELERSLVRRLRRRVARRR